MDVANRLQLQKIVLRHGKRALEAMHNIKDVFSELKIKIHPLLQPQVQPQES